MAETKKAQNLENQQEDVFDTVSNASRSSNEEKPNVRRSYKEEVNITKLQHNNVNCVEEPLLKFVDNRKNLKEDSIYVNILKQIIITDTSSLNWNKYGQQGYKLQEIGDIFSDNILLAGLTPVQLITREKDTNMKNSGVAIEIHRKTINNFFTLYNIPVRADKIQLAGVRLADGENGHVCVKNEEIIEKVYKFFMDRLPEKQDELSTGKREILAQYFKVELSSLDYKYVIDAFSKKNIKYLINNFVYIGDIDFTLDMQGSFNKQEIINYLLTQKNFRMQHVTEDNEENRNFYNGTILDNNHLVGRNCLSFMQDNIRYKVYNKFVQSIETKNNKDKIGTNIYNWINNKEDRLYNTIPQTQETGHTRLELTYYVKNNEIPTREYIEETINYLHNLIPEKLTYKTPIKEQWRAYVENKQDNVILYDMDNKNLLVCYSINKDYNKISGVFLKGVTEYDYIYVLRNCLYKMPINLYLLSWILKPEKKLKTSYTTGETGKREKVTTEVETEIKYIKLSSYLVDAIKENMDTYIITPKNIYFTKDKAQATIKNKKLYTPQEQGLIDTDKINFRYAEDDGKDKKHNKNVIKNINCLFNIHANINIPEFVHKTEYKKELEINTYEQVYKEDINKVYNANVENYNNFVVKQQKLKDYREFVDGLDKKFCSYSKKTLTKDFKIGDVLDIHAIKPVTTRYGDNFLLLNNVEDYVFYANTRLKNYINAVISSLQVNDFLIYHLPNLKPILNVKILDIFVQTGKEIATLDIKTYGYLTKEINKLIIEKEEEKENIKEDLLQQLDPNIKECTCKKLNELTEGNEYTITHLEKKNSKKTKFLFKVAEDPDSTYVSNSFLEDLLQETEHTTKFKIKIGVQKRDKNKKLQATVYM